MAYEKKTWTDRMVEFAGRRTLKNVSTNEESVVDVTRNEGQVSQPGDSFSAETMNDLENRIETAINEVSENFSTAVNEIGDAVTALGVEVPVGSTPSEIANLIETELMKKPVEASGTYNLGTINSGETQNVTIPFGIIFAAPPIVSAVATGTNSTGSINYDATVTISNVTTIDFTAEVTNPRTGEKWYDAVINWNAYA